MILLGYIPDLLPYTNKELRKALVCNKKLKDKIIRHAKRKLLLQYIYDVVKPITF